ncbi:MAG: DoxX family protein [Woeseiaceae bacterium]
MNAEDQTNFAALLLRIGLGTVFIAHGFLKVFVVTLPGAAQFFESAGFPGWLAYPVAILEIGGGALLIAGIATRIVSVVLIPILVGAFWFHSGNGWLFVNTHGGWEYPAFLIVATAAQGLLGSGAFALRLRADQRTE